MREVTEADIAAFINDRTPHSIRDTEFKVSVTSVDIQNGSPKIGDFVARNPKDHNDQWLVSGQYAADNLELIV